MQLKFDVERTDSGYVFRDVTADYGEDAFEEFGSVQPRIAVTSSEEVERTGCNQRVIWDGGTYEFGDLRVDGPEDAEVLNIALQHVGLTDTCEGRKLW